VVGVALALSACASAGGEDGVEDVVVVGDSITHLAQDEVARQAGDGFRFTIQATNGATSTEMLAEAQELGDRRPDQVVINLGTNDLNQDVPADETIENIRAIADLFASADCIHLTTLNEHIVSYERPILATRAEEMNDRFHQLVEEDGDFDLVDWNLAIEQYIAEGRPEGPLLYDTVHPTEVGQRILTGLYTDALRSC
jgi:lysophospholipase L1-like esterase